MPVNQILLGVFAPRLLPPLGLTPRGKGVRSHHNA